MGDKIASTSGNPVTITSIKGDASERDVYNLTINEDHSYAVGELGVWSHNGLGAYIVYKGNTPIYIGKGGLDRAAKSKKYHKGTHVRHFGSPKTDCASFRLEDRLIRIYGGIGNLKKNRINSPGRNLLLGGKKR